MYRPAGPQTGKAMSCSAEGVCSNGNDMPPVAISDCSMEGHSGARQKQSTLPMTLKGRGHDNRIQHNTI